jgi:hypothetical protein
MFADVLDAPVAKLPVSDDVDAGEHLIDARTLAGSVSTPRSTMPRPGGGRRRLTLSSSKQFSKMFCTTKLPVSPKATSCHMPRRASLTYFMIWGGESFHRSSNNFCHT